MPCVETISTARTGRWAALVKGAGLAGAVVTLIASSAFISARAVADPIATARAQAAQIAATVAQDSARLDELSQQYDVALQKVKALQAQIAQVKSAIANDEAQVATDRANLQQQALSTYMTGGTSPDLTTLFSSGGMAASEASEYTEVASGNLQTAVDALNVAQSNLATQQSQLQTTESAAQGALNQVAASRQAAQATIASEKAAYDKANAQVQSLVAEEQARRLAAQAAAFAARYASAIHDVPASGAGGRALGAAESQIGTPYVWGGEDPGVGFDCSGLTQWSWAQAGVSIPRTASEQYDSVVHIPWSEVQPGDLVFWWEGGGIGHVAVYAGGGEVVTAPSYGERVRLQAIWSNGLAGAGRP